MAVSRRSTRSVAKVISRSIIGIIPPLWQSGVVRDYAAVITPADRLFAGRPRASRNLLADKVPIHLGDWKYAALGRFCACVLSFAAHTRCVRRAHYLPLRRALRVGSSRAPGVPFPPRMMLRHNGPRG